MGPDDKKVGAAGSDVKDQSISQIDGSLCGGGMSALIDELAKQYYSKSGFVRVIDVGGSYKKTLLADEVLYVLPE